MSDFIDKIRKMDSMITRKEIDDHTRVDILDFVQGEYVVNVQSLKEDGDIVKVILYFKSGRRLHIYHDQDCCECVSLIDVVGGSLDCLVGQEIKCIKSVSKDTGDRLIALVDRYLEVSNTWTFITISTFKDDLTLRWLGNSNGYYSESVDFAYYDKNNDRLY